MTQEVSDFIPRLLEDRDKHIEDADGHHATVKQKGQVKIKMCDNNGNPFIATLYNALFAPDLYNRLFSIITLMSSGHTCLFHKRFCALYFVSKWKKSVTLPHSAQRKHAILGEINRMPKTKKIPSRKKITLELLHQRLVHI